MSSEPLSARQIEQSLRDELGLTGQDVIAHVDVNAIGPISGGAEALLAAILAASGTLIMPAFTYQTQVIPQVGPPNNAMQYGTGEERNARAETFRPDLTVHPDMGRLAEMLRSDHDTIRSTHPILSFCAQGPHAKQALASQTRENPLGPIAWLEAHDGVVLMMGLDHRHNISLHLAEHRAGRAGFIRWALTFDDIEELHNIPGDRDGFNTIWPELMQFARVTQIGLARCEVIPIKSLLAYAESKIRQDPNFLLCDKPACPYCRARQV